MSHDQLQQKCWIYLWNYFPESRYTCWHTKNEDIPHKNESKRDYVIRRSQDKSKGLLPGVWDLVLYHKGILFIFDIKVGKDRFSDTQIRFKEQIERNGGESYEIKDFESFVNVINSIYEVRIF